MAKKIAVQEVELIKRPILTTVKSFRKRYENRSLTQEQVRRILLCVESLRDSAMISLGFGVGLRVSEVSSFNQDSIDWQQNQIKIWDEKKNVFRDVTVPDEVMIKLRQWINESKPGPNVVFNIKSRAVERAFQKWCLKGLGFARSWHTVRHTYVTLSMESGVPPAVVCKNTGDRESTIIRYYTNLSPGYMKKVMNEFGKFLETSIK